MKWEKSFLLEIATTSTKSYRGEKKSVIEQKLNTKKPEVEAVENAIAFFWMFSCSRISGMVAHSLRISIALTLMLSEKRSPGTWILFLKANQQNLFRGLRQACNALILPGSGGNEVDLHAQMRLRLLCKHF